MNNFHSILVICAALCTFFACSSGGGDVGEENQAACEAYVNTYNELPCVSDAVKFDVGSACAPLSNFDCDVSEYYDCLSQSWACTEIAGISTPDANSISTCGTNPTCR